MARIIYGQTYYIALHCEECGIMQWDTFWSLAPSSSPNRTASAPPQTRAQVGWPVLSMTGWARSGDINAEYFGEGGHLVAFHEIRTPAEARRAQRVHQKWHDSLDGH